MSADPRHEAIHVAFLHPDPAVATSLARALPQRAVGATAFDLGWGPISIAVVHCATSGWQETIGEVRRRSPTARIAVIADTLDAAIIAVNQLRVDRLLTNEQDVVETVAELAQEPLSTAAQLEREVQARTTILQQVKSQWEQSFDAVQDPMAVMDRNYQLVRVNRAYSRHVGQPIVDVPGKVCHVLRGASQHAYPREPDGPCIACPVAESLRLGTASEATLIDQRGLRWVVSAYPVDLPDLTASLVVHYRDVTQEVERLVKIAKADKMSAVGKLAGAVAHELNSPMTSIMVFSESLARKTAEGSELHDHANQINESAQRCRRLIQGLLRFARRPPTRERHSVCLDQVIADIRPLIQHRIDLEQIELEVDLPANLRPIRGDIAAVEHLVVDLVSNALEACSPGDTISISAINLDEQSQVELQVSDSGRGMTAEVLEAAFDPFFTTKQAGQAAGLGLTTCDAIVTDMGGTMGLSSEPGEGTRAWVRLPRIDT